MSDTTEIPEPVVPHLHDFTYGDCVCGEIDSLEQHWFDITNVDARLCDQVVLIGKSGENQIFICDVAKWCDTIDYEIITKITSRVKRKYIK